jgi:hypothetical protein
MKKVFLSLSVLFLSTGILMAQSKKNKHAAADVAPAAAKMEAPAQAAVPAPAAAPQASNAVGPIVFTADSHSFGTVSEGAPAEYEFAFKNTSGKPIVIQRVQPSCGCTTPSYSKEPVAPGQTGTVKASYGTTGRPGEFNKTLTVFYLVGDDTNPQTKVLSITGTVEKAPTTSVPENNSMIKTN